MEHSIFWYIYCLPLYWIVLIIIFLVAVWIILGNLFQKKRFWTAVNRIIGIISLGVICYLTLCRNVKDNGEAILIPFYSFVEMKVQPEIGRQMLMNLFLFVPLGLSAPYAIECIVNNRLRTILISIGLAFGLSVLIESVQYLFKLGLCEMDDVITNTLGAAIGVVPYMITSRKTHMTDRSSPEI